MYKTAILAEMAVLYGGSLVNEYRTHQGEGWTMGIVSKSVLKKGIAVVGLLALLTLVADVGFGGAAAAFGGLIVLSYVLALGAGFGQALVEIENGVFTP